MLKHGFIEVDASMQKTMSAVLLVLIDRLLGETDAAIPGS
jgi:hypothetical protein